MGFFSELKEDLSQAVNELLPSEEETTEEAVTEETVEEAVAEEPKDRTETVNDMQEEVTAVPNDAKSLEEMLENMNTEELFAGIREEAGEDFFDEEGELPELEEGSYFTQTLKEAVEEQMSAAETAAQESVPETEGKIEETETFEEAEVQEESEAYEEPKEESLEDFLAAALAKLPQEPEEEILPELTVEDNAGAAAEAAENVSEIGSLQEDEQVIEEKEENEENTSMNMDMLPEEGMLGEETVLENNENTIAEEIGGFTMDAQLENKTAVDETAVITAGMTINGDMVSEGSVEVIGNVIGNIEILGKLNITGSIQGNSKAAEVYAENARITGEISSEGSVKIGQSSVIIGNISATSAVIAGAVKGDIDVHGPVILDTSAIVMGNIKSKSVQINNGAVIEGMCSQCYADVNPTSFFEDFKKSKNK